MLVEDLGLVPGNRVLLRGANTPMLVACWLAVLKAGGIVVGTMPLLRARELAYIVDKAEVCACALRRAAGRGARARARPELPDAAAIVVYVAERGAPTASKRACAASRATFAPATPPPTTSA